MHRPLVALFALAASLAAARPLAAQPRRPSYAATLGGVRYTLPANYTLVRELSDDSTTLYTEGPTRTWAFVALLPSAEERPAVVRSLLRRIGGRVLGGDPDTLEWQLVPSFPMDSSDVFHQRLVSLGGAASLDLSVRQLRAGGHDVLVGSAFVIRDERSPLALCGAIGNFPAIEAEEWLARSVLGRPAPDPVGIVELHMPRVALPEEPPKGAVRPPPPHPEAAHVLDAYEAYARALRTHDGAAAASRVSAAVLAFYEDLRTLALRATPREVRALPLIERMMVLTLRHRYEPARVRAMTARELFALSAATDVATDTTLRPDTPVVQGDFASLTLKQGERRTSLRVGFVRQRGGWLVDILPMVAGSGCLLHATLRARGVARGYPENTVLLRALQVSSGRAPADDIWEPLERTGAP